MAWLGRFDDFDKFDDATAAKPASKQKQKFKPSFNQGGDFKPPETKRLCEITAETSSVYLLFDQQRGLITDFVGVIDNLFRCSIVAEFLDVGAERYLVAFTLRDSPSCFVNVTCWGNIDFITNINTFQIGDIVQVKNAQVLSKATHQNDKFKPWTPISFQLSVSENHSSVEAYKGWDAAVYTGLLHKPTRPHNDYYTLEDITVSGAALQGEHINILAAVKQVGQISYLMTKTGKETKKCDVMLFDDTCQCFPLDLWDHHADLALLWTPFETVIFAADVKMAYSSFKSCMVATTDSKTLFTTDPDTQEARCLYQFLKTQDASIMEIDFEQQPFDDVDPDLSSIKEVFTVDQIKQKQEAMAQCCTNSVCYGIICVMLTTFDIDSDSRTKCIIRRICAKCKKRIGNYDSATCTNPDCVPSRAAGRRRQNTAVAFEYDIQVSVTDHTGTIGYCCLQPSVAETLLGCPAATFMKLPHNKRTAIKWQYLLEYFKAVFKLQRHRHSGEIKPSVQILSMEKQFPPQRSPSKGIRHP